MDGLLPLREKERAWGAFHETTTLAGARVQVIGDVVRIVREAGAITWDLVGVDSGHSLVFDGRFELTAPAGGFTIFPASGRLSRLPSSERAALKALPPAARRALPLAQRADGSATCPLLHPEGWRVRNLVHDRLIAACRLVQDEATISHVGENKREPLNQQGRLEGLVHELA